MYDCRSSAGGHTGVRMTVPVALLCWIGMFSGCACAISHHTFVLRQNCGICGILHERNADQIFHSTYQNRGIHRRSILCVETSLRPVFSLFGDRPLLILLIKCSGNKRLGFGLAKEGFLCGDVAPTPRS
jgi:hypothetical protein